MVLGGHGGFLIRYMENKVILFVMVDIFHPKGRYPECFVLISLWEACEKGGYLEDVEGS